MRRCRSGIAIVLAWPETFCKQAMAWYDLPMRWLRFNIDYYYQAGHAAVILVEKRTGDVRYFDFGRYHAPHNQGRARSAETDTELAIFTKVEVDLDRVANINEILAELQQNKSCHGDGTLYSSQIPIDYNKALDKALEVQGKHFIPYGPFVCGGSNCSRFVRTVVQAGNPPLRNLIPLKFFVPFTPTTLSNVKAGGNRSAIPKLNAEGDRIAVIRPNYRNFAKGLEWLNETYPAPKLHTNVPEDAQWLSGEGYGSWYAIIPKDDLLELNEYGSEGKFESRAFFKKDAQFQPAEPYFITYPSNCKILSIKQKNRFIQMFAIDDPNKFGSNTLEKKVV